MMWNCVNDKRHYIFFKLQVPEQSVMDLLNIPLPTSFPECEDVSQYQYFSEKKGGSELCICCFFFFFFFFMFSNNAKSLTLLQ